MKWKHLRQMPPAEAVDAVAAILQEHVGLQQPLGWFRFVLLRVARTIGITGVSVAALTMNTVPRLVEAIA